MLPRVAAFAGSCLVAFASVFSAQTPNGSAPARPDFGTTDRILVLVGAEEFQSRSSTQAWARATGLYSIGGIAAFDATLHLPSGALLTYLELDYCDTSPAEEVLVFIEDCNFLGGNCGGFAALSSNDGFAGCNNVSMDLTGYNYVVDNNVRRLRLLASTQSGSTTNQLIGAYIGYKLQVSPAPAVATFSDVPTDHPFFRFVEALSRAGITSGCGGGNFCPDAPLTRGQMAVFLAVALGLHFPN
jgi:hypothetical protein